MGFDHECFDCAFKHLSRALVLMRLQDLVGDVGDAETASTSAHTFGSTLQFALHTLQEMEEQEYRNVDHLAYFVGACSVLETVAWIVGDQAVRANLREVRNEVYTRVGASDLDEESIAKLRDELVMLGQTVGYSTHQVVGTHSYGIVVADLLHALEHLVGTELYTNNEEECRELGAASVVEDDVKAMLALVYESVYPQAEEVTLSGI